MVFYPSFKILHCPLNNLVKSWNKWKFLCEWTAICSNMGIKQNSCNFPTNRLPLRNVSNKASSLPALNRASCACPDPPMFFHQGVEFQFPYMIEVFDSWNFCRAGSKHLWECSGLHPCCTCLQAGWGFFCTWIPLTSTSGLSVSSW